MVALRRCHLEWIGVLRRKFGNGQEAVGPYDSRTGWSYSVTEVRPISKDSGPDVVNSICVELRSPEGITKTRCILKTLPDFMKLITDLEEKFPKKIELRKLKTRCRPIKERCNVGKEMEELLSEIEGSLALQVPSIKQEWITKLLSDIDLSRSPAVAFFLELEAAVRAFHSEDQDVNPQNSEANSHGMPTRSNLPAILGSSSIKSDYASDTAYGKAEPRRSRIRKDGSIRRLGGAEASSSMDILRNLDLCGSDYAQLFHPLDVVKTDMKYLEARLEQEKAVRIYHEAKIKEIEVEQEIDRQKIEALNQVLTAEKNTNILLRWQMDDLQRTSLICSGN